MCLVCFMRSIRLLFLVTYLDSSILESDSRSIFCIVAVAVVVVVVVVVAI